MENKDQKQTNFRIFLNKNCVLNTSETPQFTNMFPAVVIDKTDKKTSPGKRHDKNDKFDMSEAKLTICGGLRTQVTPEPTQSEVKPSLDTHMHMYIYIVLTLVPFLTPWS